MRPQIQDDDISQYRSLLERLQRLEVIPALDWSPLTVANSGLHANLGSGGSDFAFRVDKGVARIRGHLTGFGAITSGTTLFTLPAAARPVTWQRDLVAAYKLAAGTASTTILSITTAGAVSVSRAFASSDILYLDGVNFSL